MMNGAEDDFTSIVVFSDNSLRTLQMCLDAVFKYTQAGTFEVIVIDNGSVDGSAEFLARCAGIALHLNKTRSSMAARYAQALAAAQGQELLFLLDTTVVTERYIECLKGALYSNAHVGAVGMMRNAENAPTAEYRQELQCTYDTFSELDRVVREFQAENGASWEQRLKLAEFCLFFSRAAMEEVGAFDASLVDSYELDDYLLRLRMAGYKPVVCKSTFVHDFGNQYFYQPDMRLAMDQKFKDKWGFSSKYSCAPNHRILGAIEDHRRLQANKAEIRVLEIGCACGATLLALGEADQKAHLYGMELNEGAAAVAKTFAAVSAGDIESGRLDYENDFFDYIILADVLEHLRDPGQTLCMLKSYLKPEGLLVVSIPNIMHYTVLKDLLGGRFTYAEAGILDKTHLRFFTKQEFHSMLVNQGYQNIRNAALALGDEAPWAEDFIRQMMQVEGACQDKNEFRAYQYLFVASKG